MDNAIKIKKLAYTLGADLCGIAPVERFHDAPQGFHPKDIYHLCESVIVIAKRIPAETVFARSCVPYTHVNNIIRDQIDHIAISMSLFLQDMRIHTIPVPASEPYEYWIPEISHGRAILSLRHAGYLAGLGVLGKNTLLINQKYGNMIRLAALLINKKLVGDPIATYHRCDTNCRICITSCPQSALNGVTVDQKRCRGHSSYITKKGDQLITCNICRRVCPYYAGLAKKNRPVERILC
jgi:epoxyqueuosine reductase QueG